MRASSVRIFAASLIVLIATTCFAGGPLYLFAPNDPYKWPATVISVFTDLGTLTVLTNSESDLLTLIAISEWSAVPSSHLSGSVVGDFASLALPDIVGANAGLVVGADNGGGIHVIYDHDGTIHSEFFGAPPGIKGIGSLDFATGSTITESWVVLNGTEIDPGDIGGAQFQGVVTHETGHAINLAHSQVNGAIWWFGDEIGPSIASGDTATVPCPTPYAGSPGVADLETMYPFIDVSPGGSGTGLAVGTVEHREDVTALSKLYPSGSFPAGTATIDGTVFDTDGVTELGGINVVVRNIADPFADAVSMITGAATQNTSDGEYELVGLTPGANHVLYVDEIVSGQFSQAPLIPLPGNEEYWNLAESANPLSDDPCGFDNLNVAANSTFTANVTLNLGAFDPNMSVAPSSLVFSVPQHWQVSQTIAISNTGTSPALPLLWSITEVDPPAPLGRGSSIVSDGGFELGPTGSPWTVLTTNSDEPVICTFSTCGDGGGTGPRTGAHWAWFGGNDVFDDTVVKQNVTIPDVPSATLEFYIEIPSCDSSIDHLDVDIDGSQVYTISGSSGLCGLVGYTKQTVDISTYADGGTHEIKFQGTTFGLNSNETNFFIDDVTILAVPDNCAWLTASPDFGTTADGESDEVVVIVDATGLALGMYECQLEVASNSPATPTITIPVMLTVTDATSADELAGAELGLAQNTPNPFSSLTTIPFGLPQGSAYELAIFDVAGRRLRQYSGVATDRRMAIHWDGRDGGGSSVGAGIYFYRLTSPEHESTRRMTLLR